MRARPGTPLLMRGLPAMATGIPMMPVEPWPAELPPALVAVSPEMPPLMIRQLVHAPVRGKFTSGPRNWHNVSLRSPNFQSDICMSLKLAEGVI